MHDTSWIERFPALSVLSPDERNLLATAAMRIRLPAATTVFAPGMTPDNFLLLLEGTVRVQQVSPGGREIVLYRVHGGESCIMTTACLLASESYAAEGVTETAVEAIAIPKAAFDAAMAKSATFRRVVFGDYAQRIAGLMHLIEDVAFERMDKRLAQRLINRAGSDGIVVATQQELAADLGTAREVVSRQLKELERRGLVSIGRGKIELTDRSGLSSLAAAG